MEGLQECELQLVPSLRDLFELPTSTPALPCRLLHVAPAGLEFANLMQLLRPESGSHAHTASRRHAPLCFQQVICKLLKTGEAIGTVQARIADLIVA